VEILARHARPLRPGAGLRDNPSTQRLLVDEGDVDGAHRRGRAADARTYVWPYQMHASIGPSCALADWQPQDGSGMQLRCWAGSQNPHVLRADLAKLMGVDDVQVDVVRMEAAGCYGRNGADDVAADAALLARAVGAPVRVQLTREQEHAWEPKGAAQLMESRRRPDGRRPHCRLRLRDLLPVERRAHAGAAAHAHHRAGGAGLRDGRPHRAPAVQLRQPAREGQRHGADRARLVAARRVGAAEFVRARVVHRRAGDRGGRRPGAVPPAPPEDPRAVELVQATAQKAGWRMRTGPQENADGGLGEGGDILFGQGFAYARYIHSKWPGFGAAWAAWVADVEVNRKTGEVHVRRVVVGHDAGLMINPAGVEHQVHGNVIQTTSRALKEEVKFAPQQQQGASSTGGAQLPGVLPSGVVASREWGSYPIINFREVPVIEVMHMPRPGEPSLGAGESSSVPGTAAIANAIFDATGVRFREPPFTPEKVLAELNPLTSVCSLSLRERAGVRASGVRVVTPSCPHPSLPPRGEGARHAPWPRAQGPVGHRRRPLHRRHRPHRRPARLALRHRAGVADRPGLQPVHHRTRPRARRARRLRRVPHRAGRCAQRRRPRHGHAVRHALHHQPHARCRHRPGPLVVQRFPARDARRGLARRPPPVPGVPVHRIRQDQRRRPAGALRVLHVHARRARRNAEVRAQVPVQHAPVDGRLERALPRSGALPPVATQSAEWNRGAYLVNGLGHCGACHTPRNALGAEQGGSAFLSGAMVDGWEAPALTRLSKSAVPWDADELYRYLRQGHTHAMASRAVPMAEVVRELAQVPDADVRAMATYLASFNPAPAAEPQAVAQQVVDTAARTQGRLLGPAQRMFDSACASCHHDGDGPTLLGVNTPLALNSNLASARPDNLLRTILDGVREPASRDIGFMPAFREALDDRQIAELAGYMRARFAPQEPAWADLPAQVARVRAASAH
jgi:nicotinate dehydrogenase subunit B